jgi:hypothetical protein
VLPQRQSAKQTHKKERNPTTQLPKKKKEEDQTSLSLRTRNEARGSSASEQHAAVQLGARVPVAPAVFREFLLFMELGKVLNILRRKQNQSERKKKEKKTR